MLNDREIQIFGCIVEYYLNAWIAKLYHLSAIGTNQMIMLFGFKSFFKLGNVFPKLVFNDQFAIEQQINGVVKCGTTDPVVLIFHGNIERLYIEMAVVRVDLIQYGISFGGFTVPIFFQIFCENLPDRFFV